MPAPVQRVRIKGQPGMPPGAKYVGRRSKWGNPWKITRETVARGRQEWVVRHIDGRVGGGFRWWENAARTAINLYRQHLDEHPELVEAARAELGGKDLACWCKLPTKPGQPDLCHRSVLLELLADEGGA